MTTFDPMQKQVRSILLSEWDPIGVRDVPAAQDEYDAYVVPLVHMLLAGQQGADVAARLLEIETQSMGLRGDAARAERVARRLIACAEQARSRR